MRLLTFAVSIAIMANRKKLYIVPQVHASRRTFQEWDLHQPTVYRRPSADSKGRKVNTSLDETKVAFFNQGIARRLRRVEAASPLISSPLNPPSPNSLFCPGLRPRDFNSEDGSSEATSGRPKTISERCNHGDSSSRMSKLMGSASEKRSGHIRNTSTPLDLRRERIQECRDILSNAETFEDLATRFSHSLSAVTGPPLSETLANRDQGGSTSSITEQQIPAYPSFDVNGSSTAFENSEAHPSVWEDAMCYFVHTEPTLCHGLPTLEFDIRWARVDFSPSHQVTITHSKLFKQFPKGLEAKVETWLDGIYPQSPHLLMPQPTSIPTDPPPFEELGRIAQQILPRFSQKLIATSDPTSRFYNRIGHQAYNDINQEHRRLSYSVQ
jgi:hypothetical protein